MKIRKNQYKGFSIFEIMIVLVILIILIGVGYPFWSNAVASAQKTTALSHLRQLAQCIILYTTHNEGQLPSGYVKNLQTGNIEVSGAVPKAAVFPPSPTNDESHWSSQIFPYAKQKEIYTAPGFLEKGGTQNLVAFTYNGLLHEYSLLQISQPSAVPVFWCGLGKIALSGKAFTTPYLVTANTSNPKIKNCNPITVNKKFGDPGVDGWFAENTQLEADQYIKTSYGSFYVYNKFSPMVFLDGSARSIKSHEVGFTYDDKGIPKTSNQGNKVPEFFKPK